MNDLVRAEWEAWRSLCDVLKEAGVVTEEDLHSRAGTLETKGQWVFATSRDWGEARVVTTREPSQDTRNNERSAWAQLCLKLREAGLQVPEDGGAVGGPELRVVTAIQSWGEALTLARLTPEE